jgi:hypothetical protein
VSLTVLDADLSTRCNCATMGLAQIAALAK